jgi:hypothetical protein
MLSALEPRRGKSAEAQSNLTKSLEKLFERKGLRQEKGLVDDRLEKRLTSIQQTRDSKE